MKEEEKEILIKKYFSSPKGWKRWLISKDNKELYNSLLEEYKEPETISEKIYWLAFNIKEFPKCKICGNRTVFEGQKSGYRKYCSCKCAQSDKEVRKKLKETCIEKYGVDNPAKSEQVQNKMKNTCLKRYGTKNVFASDYGKNKIKETLIKKYGVDNPQKLKEISNKTKNTMLKKYGVNCGYKLRKNNNTSIGELELYNFIKENYEDAIHNDYNTIGPFELDIYIPSLRIGIEYDGDYWHSLPDMIKRDKRKNFLCERRKIKLIRVKETEWKNNINIKENILEEING